MTTPANPLDINPQIECAETLAGHFYTDPSMLAREKVRIFRRTWQLVGTVNQPCGEGNGVKRTIADPESFFTFDVAGEPVVVTRDKSGVLRAFSNVCRHRAGPIAQGTGCKHVLRLRLPRLDIHARRPPDWHAGHRRRRILRPHHDGHGAAACSKPGNNFIFVNFDAERPAACCVSRRNIPSRRETFRSTACKLAERRDYIINCNWKVYVDNYLEGYHIPSPSRPDERN